MEFNELSHFGQVAKYAYDNRELLAKALLSPPKVPQSGVDLATVRRWSEAINDAVIALGDGSEQSLEDAIRILDRVDLHMESVIRSKHAA